MAAGDLYDITIVGGGPAGMYAAFYAGMRDMKVKLIEGKGELGGFLHTYPEKTIWDVGGIPPIRGEQLIVWLAQQARTFNPTLVFHQRVNDLQRLPDGNYRLRTDTGELHDTRTIVLAVGRGITEVQKLDITGADRYELNNLYYTVQDLESFRGKRVLVSGGGNSAVDWAIELASVAKQVTVVHRRDEFAAMEHSVAVMKEVAEVRTPYSVKELHGEKTAIHTVSIARMDSGELERLEVDAVVVSHGYTRNHGDILKWGLKLDEAGIAVSDQTETNLPGIFAAGDCAAYNNKVKLIAGAFIDAVLAVNNAKQYIDPTAHSMAYVSSHNEKFREMNRQVHALRRN
ncbi:NAD(P)/FAD-dependent oxidoreductase [Paenibacillaceae bacterium WGS1546]|uniref:NAD(P)/FAD-dependent oxidoreductase n=1 Tax=Cohnella sp. WGS1546 TaxID=3366810 RepID=UPI00372D2CE4